MITAKRLLEKLNKIDVTAAAQKSITATGVYAEDAQRVQLFQGLNQEETRIRNVRTGSDQYAPLTVQIKSAKGQPTDRITLKDQGDYYSGMKLEVRGEMFRIYSVDEKADYLDVIYTPLGLGSKARSRWIVPLKPEFVKNIKAYLQ